MNVDTSLKQRLIGAIVLVALAVIFLPMLIKGPAPDSGVSDVSMRVPAAPNGEYETRELPLVTPGAPAGDGVTGLAPNGTAAAAGSSVTTTPLQENPDAADLATPATAATPRQASPPATAAGKYAVNFGAYATSADADKVVTHLRQSQLPGYSEATTVNGKPAWRVRIGPYTTQAQAEAIRLQAVKVRSDVRAQVVALDAQTPAAEAQAAAARPASVEPAKPAVPVAKPMETKPAPKPAETKPLETPKPVAAKPAETSKPAAVPAPAAANVGFAVQLGAFTSADEANSLRDRARAAGFSAFVEQVRTDKGMLNRVRVGPVANRDDAEKLKAQVAAKLGVGGMVRPHP